MSELEQPRAREADEESQGIDRAIGPKATELLVEPPRMKPLTAHDLGLHGTHRCANGVDHAFED